MSTKPKRLWYQFSLRMLMAVMLALGLVLGICGRIAFLRQRARFHDDEYLRCLDSVLKIYYDKHGVQSFPVGKSLDEVVGADEATRIRRLIARSQRHAAIADRYRHAVYRPWTIINEGPLESDTQLSTIFPL